MPFKRILTEQRIYVIIGPMEKMGMDISRVFYEKYYNEINQIMADFLIVWDAAESADGNKEYLMSSIYSFAKAIAFILKSLNFERDEVIIKDVENPVTEKELK